MKTTKCTKQDLEMALEHINKKYDGNIKFNPDSDLPKRFTLRVHNGGPGSAFGSSYLAGFEWAKKRRTGSACWHVHGDFFDALFKINPNATIYSRGNQITKDYGNWKDFSVHQWVYASDCCECHGKI